MAPTGAGRGDSSDAAGVETFVWRDTGGRKTISDGCNLRPCWTIRHRKSSRIYDSDPHSLKIPRSHNAWKKELMMTRFANQELPEALWGDNFLEISYEYTGDSDSDSDSANNSATKPDRNNNTNTQKNPSRGVRISFSALEALRTWALMDMDVERGQKDGEGANDNANGGSIQTKSSLVDNNGDNDNNKLPTIIPHKSGRIPDAWDYTYTTNYSGSVECTDRGSSSDFGDGSFDTKQPDQTTVYAIKISPALLQESTRTPETISSKPTVELRPPMCKCVGGRMICAGVAQSLATTRGPLQEAAIRLPKLNILKRPSSERKRPVKTKLSPPRPSPKWLPYCRDTDGPFDMEALLNSQRSPPLHYTGTIPFWIQNLDPQSYSFLTVTTMVCGSANSYGSSWTNDGGFLAVLLRCFVRVNGVRVRLIDTKFVIRRRSQNSVNTNSRRLAPMVVLRERSWREGSWEEYTAGMRGATNGSYQCLGTDLEQGRRASKTLPHRFSPIVDKLVLYDDPKDENGNETCHGLYEGGNESSNGHQEQKMPIRSDIPRGISVALEELEIPALKGRSVSYCAMDSRILVAVVEECTIVTLDAFSGQNLWEHSLAPCSVLSLALCPFQHSSSKHPDRAKVVVGDDRGCVHVVQWDGIGTEGTPNISKQSHCFESGNKGDRQPTVNVQRPCHWVEKLVCSPCGHYFAASAGKKIMINGKIHEMEGTVYDLAFLPASRNGDTMNGKAQQEKKPTQNLLAIALYGGLTIVDAVAMTTWHHRFTVGSSAVLSFAASPNGQSIGVGCLDKRLRVFESNGSGDNGTEDIDSYGVLGSWDARDWIGFDGGVSCVAFCPDNRRLAALGGSILLVVDRSSKWGEAPTICSIHQDSGERTGRGERFQSFAWSTKDILVASTDRCLHIFDLRATIDAVPKRSYPAASIPIEKGFLVNNVDRKVIIAWGKSGTYKIRY